MHLTVLICTHNRSKLLQRTLASLNAAARPHNAAVDILVMANHCSDQTPELLERYRNECKSKEWLPLAWFEVPQQGKSHALNCAFPHLSGDLVAFVDDDHRVDAGYLQAVCDAAHTYPDSDLFCGRILPDWNGTEPAWVHDTGPYRIYPLPVPNYDPGPEPRTIDDRGPIPGGGNLAARTRILEKVGPFDPDYGPSGHDLGGAEDLQWIRRALRLGAQMQYIPEMVQYHYVDPERLKPLYLMHKAYKRSASIIRLHPERTGPTLLPPYMVRKTLGYLGRLLISWQPDRRRFYLVRLAASLGEIRGHLQARADAKRAGVTN